MTNWGSGKSRFGLLCERPAEAMPWPMVGGKAGHSVFY